MSSKSQTDANVIALMQSVAARLKCEGRGGKARLARSLGISPEQLNHWINGGREPRAGYALRLKAWAESDGQTQDQ
jgi:DNA-binding transcriptional regulator YdaS (Cro superfamily)